MERMTYKQIFEQQTGMEAPITMAVGTIYPGHVCCQYTYCPESCLDCWNFHADPKDCTLVPNYSKKIDNHIAELAYRQYEEDCRKMFVFTG